MPQCVTDMHCTECKLIVTVYWLLGRKAAKKAKVMHEYKAENPDELTLEVGQIIEILKQVHCTFLVAVHARCTF